MFSSLFNWLMGAGRELAVVLISMVPLVELRGAVPLGAVAGVPAIADPAGVRRIPFLLFFGESCWTGCSLGLRFPALPPKYREKSCSERPVRSPGMNGWVCSLFVAIRCRARSGLKIHRFWRQAYRFESGHGAI